MEKNDVIVLNPVKKGIQTNFSKLLKMDLRIIIVIFLILFIIYYVIASKDGHNFNLNQDIRPFKTQRSVNTTDLHKLFNISDFKFTINQSSCPDLGLKIDLLVLVHTAPDHYDRRQMIRHTWASQKQNSKFGSFRVLFLLGNPNDSQLQSKLVLENLRYKDLIQGSFIDHYRNLTYKHVMGLKWITNFCKEAKVVLKCDDDVFVNMPFLLQSFETSFWETIQDTNKDVLFCNLMVGSEIIRDNQTKYYVSEETLKGKVFPPYCSGYAIFYASQTAQKLYEEAQKLPYLNIDDAFVTGVVREKTTINITEFNYLENPDIERLLKDLKDYQEDKMRNFFIGPFEILPETMKELWDALLNFMKRSDTVV